MPERRRQPDDLAELDDREPSESMSLDALVDGLLEDDTEDEGDEW